MKVSLFIAAALILGAMALSAQDSYKAMDVPNGGTIQGVVIWKGKLPELEQIPVKKDQETCGTVKTTACFKVGKNNGVANTVVFLEGISQGKKMPPAPKPVMDQIHCEYVPHVMLVPAGTEIEITNSDPFLHNVHFYKEDSKTLFNLAFPFKGMKVNKVMPTSERFLSLCDAGHPWMSAHVAVMNHPYYALTDAEGRYILDQVPPGTYKISMWHEGIPEVKDTNTPFLAAKPFESTKQVTVTAKGKVVVDFEMAP